jgi:hypothetical protein
MKFSVEPDMRPYASHTQVPCIPADPLSLYSSLLEFVPRGRGTMYNIS